MNKHEKELLTKLYWLIQENKNEHHILYYSKDVLQCITKGEYGIARNLLDRKFVSLPRPSTCDMFDTDLCTVYRDKFYKHNTACTYASAHNINKCPYGLVPDVHEVHEPPCPACGSMRYRIIYKDDAMTEVDWYDCLMCRHHWC